MIAFEPLTNFSDQELNDLFRRALDAMRRGPAMLRELRRRQVAALEKEMAIRKERIAEEA